MKKKTLGLIINFKGLLHHVSAHELFLKKILENFEELILIDTDKIEFACLKNTFFDWAAYPEKNQFKNDNDFLAYLKKLLPSKFKFYQPLNLSEFGDFLKKNDIFLINSMGREFKYFGIYLKLKKYKVKHFVISNFANNDSSTNRRNVLQKLNFFFGRTVQRKIYVLLCLLNIFNKVEIRFDNNGNFIRWWMRNQKIKKYLFWKRSFFKELIPVNSLAYDKFKLSNLEVTKDYIVLIDANLNHKDDVAMRGYHHSKKVEDQHYKLLNEHLEHLSEIYEKEVIVCIHSEYNQDKTQNYFKNFKIFKHRTTEFIYKSFLVVFYESSVIADAFLLKKNIISLKADFEWGNDCARYQKNFGTVFLDITKEEERKIQEKKLTKRFEVSKLGYDKFVKTYIKTDGNEIGIKKIINIIKKYFNN